MKMTFLKTQGLVVAEIMRRVARGGSMSDKDRVEVGLMTAGVAASSGISDEKLFESVARIEYPDTSDVEKRRELVRQFKILADIIESPKTDDFRMSAACKYSQALLKIMLDRSEQFSGEVGT